MPDVEDEEKKSKSETKEHEKKTDTDEDQALSIKIPRKHISAIVGIFAVLMLVAGAYFIGKGEPSSNLPTPSTVPVISPALIVNQQPSLLPFSSVNPTRPPKQTTSPLPAIKDESPTAYISTYLQTHNSTGLKTYLHDRVQFSKYATSYFEDLTKNDAIVKLFALYDSTHEPWNFDPDNAINLKAYDQLLTQQGPSIIAHSGSVILLLQTDQQGSIYSVMTADIQVIE